ncbi:MAG: fatty acid desaturase family protein [Pseudomonadales bacterium]|nr:fatty acid desaturase family protein [Pseudomonadales bacterium]
MNVKDVLSSEELARISRRSDLQAAWLVVCNYGITAGIFAMMALWPNPLTILLGIILLGGRQLGFGVIVHECGHGTFFENRRLNEWVGEWLAAPPTFNNMKAYARGHLRHHKLAGTHEDPDLPNYRDYPIDRERLQRKIWRDLSGQTGWKQTRGLFKAFLNFSGQHPEQRHALARGLAVNAAMLALFIYIGAAWLYLVWWVALLTTNRLVSRLRQMAEHAAVPDLYDADPRSNTRTIAANWLDRLVFCPLGVSYHLEHHMLASVPIYNLPKLHRLLKNRGYYDGVHFPANYREMLRLATTPTPATVGA